ncbi:hypothetical protein WJX75_004651 [Coccomyxa subellipsoidea]|uniref:Uncharacterized protein n=1 Tax=Coccomyxa subellipsoidea TaxID=248742 RepID=A0ABR2YN04_9CHLO
MTFTQQTLDDRISYTERACVCDLVAQEVAKASQPSSAKPDASVGRSVALMIDTVVGIHPGVQRCSVHQLEDSADGPTAPPVLVVLLKAAGVQEIVEGPLFLSRGVASALLAARLALLLLLLFACYRW